MDKITRLKKELENAKQAEPETLTQLIIRQQKEGIENLTKKELELLEGHYTRVLPHRQGLSKVADMSDLEKIVIKLKEIKSV